ncbi:permease prefix domain 1-containing protein [Cellulomonas massiliensis]|uniref:permease prefix domain 1-containing protein n=1 Tax=Cellulomonas massiliensis TaxID=1465811 RepID=UPI000307BE7B|nr:permease prefix domain 1-containing protein [Cellulomonas massiliensis]
MTSVHRLLDDAFDGVDLTPEVQDLKEEIRANLEARALELVAGGASDDAAARQAFDELGDVRALVADAAGDAAAAAPGSARRYASGALVHRVRPRPGFVAGAVVVSLVGLAALAAGVLGAAGVLDPSTPAVLAAVAVTALAVGWVTGSSLAQETTTHHPLPAGRAAGYGAGAALVVLGGGLAGVVAPLSLPAAWYVLAGLLVVVGTAALAALGATQTNRTKAWARQAERELTAENRFEQDPAAAARFGIYTAVTWLVAFVAFVVLGFAVSWAWSWLALVGGFAVMMLVLARMLFGQGSSGPSDR